MVLKKPGVLFLVAVILVRPCAISPCNLQHAVDFCGCNKGLHVTALPVSIHVVLPRRLSPLAMGWFGFFF